MNKTGLSSITSKLACLSGGQLKAIAMLSMLIDHTNKALIYPYLNGGFLLILSDIFDIMGRIAFPLFCFMLIEGFFNTRSRKKYLLNLLIFGVISEIPFDMFTTATLFNKDWNNIMFTLALVLAFIWCIDSLKPRLCKFAWFTLSALIVAAACLFAMLTGLDYEYHAILIGYFFYLFHRRPVIAIPFGFASMYKEPWCLLGFGLTLTYNGKRGRQSKMLNYWFYPVHMLILGILRFILKI